MDDIIASFLIQNKICPLPGMGNLYVVVKPAETDFGMQKICSPRPFINYSTREVNADELVSYIAFKQNCQAGEALNQLNAYCRSLKTSLAKEEGHKLEGIGKFYVDATGDILFQENELPEIFTQPVDAMRVIHPDTEHNILVGDKETTNTRMTEYFNEEPLKKARWWIWAIIIFIVSIVVLLYYFNDPNHTAGFGNAIKILP